MLRDSLHVFRDRQDVGRFPAFCRKVKCLLCASTGRAAKRISKTTSMEPGTIHQLLESAGTSKFARNEANPLDCDWLGYHCTHTNYASARSLISPTI